MEFEQIIKQLQWLDEEHRKAKDALKTAEDNISSLEGNSNTHAEKLKNIFQELSDIGPVVARLNQFDEILSQQRKDLNQLFEDLEKKHKRREKENLNRYKKELDKLNSNLDKTAVVKELTKKVKEFSDITLRLDVGFSDLKQNVEEALRNNKEIVKSQKQIEGGRRQDLKRVADLQGEITSIRKRLDEVRKNTGLQGDSLRNLENRLTELFSSENKRNQAQAAFLEQQTLAQVEREQVYKDWLEKVEEFKLQAETLDTQTQTLEDTVRSAKRAQESYDELNQKLERRINEVTEMQRLGEDRLRQEWVTFKADDQKRWTGYTLSSEESIRDLRKAVDKFEDRMTSIDDATQTMQDQLHQTTDTTEQQLQELMNVAHQWLSAYERIMGHTRKTTK